MIDVSGAKSATRMPGITHRTRSSAAVSNRLAALLICLLSFAAFAWLSPQNPANGQVTTRLALTLSIVEDGKLDIDRFAALTIDKAKVDGHFYADKLPGHSFLAIPIVALTHAIIGGDTDDPATFRRYAFAATVGVNGLLSALAAAVLFLLAIRLDAPPPAALFASFALALATPFFGWSTAFFAHTVTGSLLIFAFALVAAGHLGGGRWSRRPTFLGAVVGLVLGYTLVVDLTSAPIVAGCGLLCVGAALRSGIGRGVQVAVGGIAGGIVGLLPLPIYNQLAFGSPLKLGYSSVVGFAGMKEGFFGITIPDPSTAFQLVFGTYRGILPLSPVLILAPLGLIAMFRAARATRVAAGVVLFAFGAQLLINSSYHYWNGGSSTGPRHLVSAIPFLAITLAFTWPRRATHLLLLAASLALSLICASVDMFVAQKVRAPLTDYLLPSFFQPAILFKAAPVLIAWAGFIWLGRRLEAKAVETRSAR
jgi:hypothetical protein